MDPIYENHNGVRICPYGPSHKMFAVLFGKHLLRCPEVAGKKFRVCPFNDQHHVVEPMSFIEHIFNCIDRVNINSTPCENTAAQNPSSAAPEAPKADVPVYADGEAMRQALKAIADAYLSSAFVKSPKVFAALYALMNALCKEGGYRQNVMKNPAYLPASLINEAAERKETARQTGVGPYGSKEVVETGILAIIDAFMPPFGSSAKGFSVLQELVETIYEETGIPFKK